MIIRKWLVFILINICLLGKNWWYYKSRLDLNLKDQFYRTVVQWQVHHMKFKSIEKYISKYLQIFVNSICSSNLHIVKVWNYLEIKVCEALKRVFSCVSLFVNQIFWSRSRPSVIKTKRNDGRRRSSAGVKTEGGLGQGDVMTSPNPLFPHPSPPRFSSAPSKVSGFLTVRVEKAKFY